MASSNEGDVVLDPFCGSGTTGVSAVKFGRRFVGVDADKEYLQNIALPRLMDEREKQGTTRKAMAG